MKTIFFLLFPVLVWGQFEPNLAKFEMDDWWTLDDPPSVVISNGETIEIVAGQTADGLIDRFDYSDYDYSEPVLDSTGILCPWQSWRFVIYQSFQVDYILSGDQIDAFEPRLADEDLIYFAMGGNRDALNIAERGYTAQIHHPGLTYPIIRNYHLIHPSIAVDWENNNPQWGWSRRLLQNDMAMAAKEISPGVYHVSFARFVLHQGFSNAMFRAAGVSEKAIKAISKSLSSGYEIK